MNNRPIALALNRIHVAYPLGRRALTAIDEVSIDIPAGQFCAIVGPSGCGKSTLLRLIAGLQTPTSGSIEFPSSSRREMVQAMVFQGRSVFPWMTVLDNAAYGLRVRGIARHDREDRAEALLHQVGLGEFLNAYPGQLSEGMRQRVALARALAIEPELLLMDEPFGALDEQTRIVMQDDLLRIWEETGKTIVFVTHSIDEAMILADRIIVLSARPATIRADIAVPFERPRSVSSVRSDPRFAAMFAEIWSLLRHDAEVAAGSV